jgi:hypothetical protein
MAKEMTALGLKTAPAIALLDAGFFPDYTIDDIEEILRTPPAQKMMKEFTHSFEITLVGQSRRDIEYQDKVLRDILEETDGHIVEELANPEAMNALNLRMIKVYDHPVVFNLAGSFGSALGFPSNPDVLVDSIKPAIEIKKKFINTGGIVDDGGDAIWGGTYEQGHLGGHFEQIFGYDPADPDSWRQAIKVYEDAIDLTIQQNWPLGLGQEHTFHRALEMVKQGKAPPGVEEMVKLYRWQRKVKKMFDPNDACDSRTYLQVDED